MYSRGRAEHLVADLRIGARRKSRSQRSACAADPALDRADLRTDEIGCGLVCQALNDDEHHGLALYRRQLGEMTTDHAQVTAVLLRGGCDQLTREHAIGILHLALALSELGVELVAQDRDQPCLQ